MFISYGTRASLLRTEPLAGACPACRAASGNLLADIYGRFFRVWFLPMWPTSRLVLVECQACQRVFQETELPAAGPLLAPVQALKAAARRPWWMWLGTAGLVVMSVVAFVQGQRRPGVVAERLAAPLVGDVYVLHDQTQTPPYTLLKVNHVLPDTLELLVNKYGTFRESKVGKLDENGKYDPQPVRRARADVQALARSGLLIDVNRP